MEEIVRINPRLTRSEKLTLAGAALRGFVSGVARAVLEHFQNEIAE